ncbi:MAG: ATP-binding protein, partial [Desulfatiglandaceae bacterium]
HLLGYGQEEILGRGLYQLGKTPDSLKSLMAEVETKGAVNNHPETLMTKDGREVEVSLSLSQLKDSNGGVMGMVGISKDVTEENRLRQQLMEQERLAAVGETVAGITHCMKNVLNGLKGGSYMLDVGLKREDARLVQEGWGNVQKGIERMSRLSMDMLTYCRGREPVLVPTDPLKFVRETADLIAPAAEQDGITISCDGDEGPPVEMDPDTMGRALLNLISNAVDACREKSYAQDETPRVEVRVERGETEVRFRVTDNGAGMSDEIRKKLFTRFFSTKEGRGTGLGLCVTEKIVGEHGGDISVESTPGKGSAFTIRIQNSPS